MDDDTDGAWAHQEELERQEREQEALRSGRIAYAELKDLHRQSAEFNRDFDKIFTTQHALHHEKE